VVIYKHMNNLARFLGSNKAFMEKLDRVVKATERLGKIVKEAKK